MELAALQFNTTGSIGPTFHQLIRPNGPIPKSISQIHGLTAASLVDAPALEIVLPKFLAFLNSSRTVVVAHNAVFDLEFLRAAAVTCNESLPEFEIIDTLALARHKCPKLRSHRLSYLAEHFGCRQRTQHRALPDAQIVSTLFRVLLNQVPIATFWGEISQFSISAKKVSQSQSR